VHTLMRQLNIPTSGKGQPSGFTNYLVTIEDAEPLRLWSIEEASESRETDKYVLPDKIQDILDLLDLEEDFEGTAPLWLEGLKKVDDLLKFEVTAISDIDEKHVLTEKKVLANVFEAKLGLNTSNDPNDPDLKLRPGVPDVKFKIGKNDELVKDQGEGFQWWWGLDEFHPITHSGIVDLFPLFIDIPSAVLDADLKPYLSITGSGEMILYPAASSAGDRREFLREPGIAEDQRGLASQAVFIDTTPEEVSIPKGDEEIEFVAKAVGQSLGLGRQQWTLTLWLDNGNNIYVPADSWRITIKDTEEFWAFRSTRGPATTAFTYPTEAGRTVDVQRFPYPAVVSNHPLLINPSKSKALVWLHGFNVTLDEAREVFNELYRRLFWVGFRGQFIGLTWDGDSTRFLGYPVQFDSPVAKAFLTSPALMRFLRALEQHYGADNVDIAAHSLGNLVMFDALRLQEITGSGPVVRNAISFEAAVWSEAFDSQDDVEYQAPSDEIFYDEEQLQQHSWAFWFNQRGQNLTRALSGSLFHSYVDSDKILLAAMRINDLVFRGLPGKTWHYNRDRVNWPPNGVPDYRTPLAFPHHIPALMIPDQRRTFYNGAHLNHPMGATPINPLADFDNQKDATRLGWRPGEHSDYLTVDIGSTDGDIWFPVIWNWYNNFIANAITIGKE